MPQPPPKVPTVRLADSSDGITVGVAAATWAVSWFVGNVLGSLVIAVFGPGDSSVTAPVWVTALGALALWIPILIAISEASNRFGSGIVRRDLRVSFRPLDLLGVPIGVLTQLVLLRLVYWPLEEFWPSTFSAPQLEKSARDLYDSADGLWLIVLVLIVVVGAPLVEELQGLRAQAAMLASSSSLESVAHAGTSPSSVAAPSVCGVSRLSMAWAQSRLVGRLTARTMPIIMSAPSPPCATTAGSSPSRQARLQSAMAQWACASSL